MWQIMQDNLPAGNLANTLALVQLSVLGVFIIKTIGILHTTTSRNWVILGTSMLKVNDSSHCRGAVRRPAGLSSMTMAIVDAIHAQNTVIVSVTHAVSWFNHFTDVVCPPSN